MGVPSTAAPPRSTCPHASPSPSPPAPQTSPLQLVGGGASLPAAIGMLLLQTLAAGGSAAQGAAATQAAVGAPVLLDTLVASLANAGSSTGVSSPLGGMAATGLQGQVMAAMPDIAVEGVASQALLAASSAASSISSGGLFDVDE